MSWFLSYTMTSPATSILALGFGMGLLHALDPDHLLTVANLTDSRNPKRAALRFCAHWALGHGGALFALGGAVLLLGTALPLTLSRVAEHVVGLVLVLMGGFILWHLMRSWCHHEPPTPVHPQPSGRPGAALIMGLLHGTAGSAPLLALAPLPALHDPMLGMTYLLVFACGVLAAMLGIGTVLGLGLHQLHRRLPWFITTVRASLACGASAVGFHLLTG